MFRNIRWRIVTPYVLVILIGMGGLALYLTWTVRDFQLEKLQSDLIVDARSAAESIGLQLNQGNVQMDDQAHYWSDLLDTRVTIIASDGRVLGESHEDSRSMENHLRRPEIQQASATGQGSNIRFSNTLEEEMLYAAVLVEMEGEKAGYVRLALPLDQIETNIGKLQRAILTAAAVTTLGIGLLAFLAANRMDHLVKRLTDMANRIAGGDLNARFYHQAPRGVLGTLIKAFNDMADRLRQQVDELTDQRGRLAAVLENMADGVLITDWLGQVTLINPAAARLLDVDEAECLGRPFAELVRHHELIELWQRSRDQKREMLATAEADREGAFLQMIVTPLDAPDRHDHLVILQDLTRIRRLETVRRDFISNVSHELRTPLASLKALVETLHDSALDDPPAARRFLEHADQEVDALTQMVQELLELTRIESGMAPLRLAPTAAANIVLPPVKRLRPQAKRRKLTLVIDTPEDLPPVLADAERVRQVVSNLVHNAIKFTPEGGQIEVRARARSNDATMVISVADTGEGIAPTEIGRIFERFYKADRARSGGGTGLGLAIARHIVQAHGGRIWVKSKEGRGSTFSFSLPLAIEETETEPADLND